MHAPFRSPSAPRLALAPACAGSPGPSAGAGGSASPTPTAAPTPVAPAPQPILDIALGSSGAARTSVSPGRTTAGSADVRSVKPVALAAAIWLALVGAACPNRIDSASSSCFGGILNKPPDPGSPYIDPNSALIFLDDITPVRTLRACFHGDLAQPGERAAVAWASLDPSIASVEPTTGPETTVTGLRFGRTRVVAVITGLRREVPVTVCNTPRDCPLP